MKDTSVARAFYWLGDSIEAIGPSVYRILAAVLPYTTPIPVAWLTMKSAESFLGFTDKVSFLFVLGLEGIGLWFTGLFVEAVVDYIRSRNSKSLIIAILFGIVVVIYVYILVNLNVILKTAAGEADPHLSRVITLMCFLPLLTGVGNGYYKMKLESKRDAQKKEERETSKKREDRDAILSFKERKLLIESGIIPEGLETFQQVSNLPRKLSNPSNLSKKVSPELSSVVETFQKVSGDWRKLSTHLSHEQMEQVANLTSDQMHEIEAATGLTYKTISNWRSNASKQV